MVGSQTQDRVPRRRSHCFLLWLASSRGVGFRRVRAACMRQRSACDSWSGFDRDWLFHIAIAGRPDALLRCAVSPRVVPNPNSPPTRIPPVLIRFVEPNDGIAIAL